MLSMSCQVNNRRMQLLNGWWDFQPVEHTNLAEQLEVETVPAKGWQGEAYLVPGFFTDHAYPAAWRGGRSGWMRTHFVVDAPAPGGRAFLTIQAAIPRAQIFVNGRKAAVQEDMFLGEAVDITAFLREGENELAVLLSEFHTFPHPDGSAFGLIDHPWGCCIAREQAGIWQDVTLEWRAAAHVADVTIRTSVREQTLQVIARVSNAGDLPFTGEVAA